MAEEFSNFKHSDPNFAREADGTFRVDGDMLISDVLMAFPKSAAIMLSYGLHCVGCHANVFDTIESGARGHGMFDSDIVKMIDEINEVINKKIETIEFTPTAIMKVKEYRALESGKETWPLRMRILIDDCTTPGYELDFDLPKPEDLHFNFDGLDVIVDPQSYDLLKGTSVDFVETSDGGGFKLDNPNNLKKQC